MWSMYQFVLNNDPRNNNVYEGGTNAINTAAGCSHPTIIPFVKILQRYNAEQEAKINQFNTAQNRANRRAIEQQSETATLMPLSMVVCFTENRQSSDIFQLYYPTMPLMLSSDQTSVLSSVLPLCPLLT